MEGSLVRRVIGAALLDDVSEFVGAELEVLEGARDDFDAAAFNGDAAFALLEEVGVLSDEDVRDVLARALEEAGGDGGVNGLIVEGGRVISLRVEIRGGRVGRGSGGR